MGIYGMKCTENVYVRSKFATRTNFRDDFRFLPPLNISRTKSVPETSVDRYTT